MTTLQIFVAAIAAFYLAEGVLFLRRGTLAFAARVGRHFRLDRAERAVTGRAVGDLALGPLWPAGSVLLSEPWPIHLDSGGLEVRPFHEIPPGSAHQGDAERVAWGDLGALEVERHDLVVSGNLRLRFGTKPSAEWHRALFLELRALSPDDRLGRIEAALDATLDEGAARERLDAVVRWRHRLGLACVALAVFVFVGLPVAEAHSGWTGLGRALVGASICLAVVMFVSWRAFGAVWGLGSATRAVDLLQCLVSPAHAMHAYHRLTRDALSTYHPLAVARVALSQGGFEAFARRVVLGLAHPRKDEDIPQLVRAAIERFVARTGLDTGALLCPPDPENAFSRTFCPRCDQQYMLDSGFCNDCPGVSLVKLGPGGRTP